MRPSRDEWALGVAQLTAKRATCLRRCVGCVLLNARGHLLATGYNGVAAGRPHCNELVTNVGIMFGGDYTTPNACAGASAPSGQGLDACQAIHAEQNALLQCRDPWQIETCYVTASPCVTCIKLLLNTSCERIVFAEAYAHSEAKEWWVSAGRQWDQMEPRL